MKKGIILITIIILVSGCSVFNFITGSGNIVEGKADFTDFSRVTIGNAFKIVVVKGPEYDITIKTDDNIIELVRFSKEGEVLEIGLKPLYNVYTETLEAYITMPDLYELELHGASRGSIEGFGDIHDFVVDLSGASELDILDDITTGKVFFELSGASKVTTTTGTISASDAYFALSGASEVTLEGSGNNIFIDASGASDLDLRSFTGNDTDVKLSGASEAWIKTTGILTYNLSGASTLYYNGPTITIGSESETTGDSKIEAY